MHDSCGVQHMASLHPVSITQVDGLSGHHPLADIQNPKSKAPGRQHPLTGSWGWEGVDPERLEVGVEERGVPVHRRKVLPHHV